MRDKIKLICLMIVVCACSNFSVNSALGATQYINAINDTIEVGGAVVKLIGDTIEMTVADSNESGEINFGGNSGLSQWVDYGTRKLVYTIRINEGVTHLVHSSSASSTTGLFINNFDNLTSLYLPRSLNKVDAYCLGSSISGLRIYVYNPNTVFDSLAFKLNTSNTKGIMYGYSGSTAESFCAGNSNWTFQALTGTPVNGTAQYNDCSSLTGEFVVDRINAIGVSQNDFVTVDSNGNWEYESVPNGSWKFVLYQDGAEVGRTGTITVKDGEVTGNTTITVTVQQKHTITGVVKDYNNQPVNNAFVVLNGLTGVYTNTEGYYSIPNVVEGTYVITVTHNGLTVSQNVNVSNDTNCDLTLPKPALVTVSGYIYNEQNEVVSNIPVTLRGKNNQELVTTGIITDTDMAVTQTDSNGYFEFNNVYPGDYSLSAVLHNGDEITQDIIVQNQDTNLGNITINYKSDKEVGVTSNGVSTDIMAIGSVNATAVIVTVPTSLAFVIQPKAENTFVTTSTTIDNQSNAPIDVCINSITGTDNTPSLVAPTVHTDTEWLNLSQEDTESQIALGLEYNNDEYWQNDKMRITSKSSIEVQPCARYGLAWSQSKDNLDYNMELLISLGE